ncbi:hypothetical protein HOD38_00345 [archaeon]|nr:hypothetical protein [archaeon]MBT4396696.1 hypothetical protein [archaeon]MBT4441306.1 hypothetical protein [archaeon]
MKTKTLSLELMEDRPKLVKVEGLPLERAVTLKLEGNRYYIPNSNPTYGIISTGSSLVIAQLNDDYRFENDLTRNYNIEGTLNLIELVDGVYRNIGGASVSKSRNKGFLSGNLVVGEDVRDLIELNNERNQLAQLVIRIGLSIINYRYHVIAVEGKQKKAYGGLSPEDLGIGKLDITKKRAKIVQGHIKHSAVKRYSLSSPLTEPTLLEREDQTFLANDKFIAIGELPVVGIYTHPYDKDKICLARLLENRSGRGRIIVTELDEGEREVGFLYFRRIADRILADGFYIGEGFTRFIPDDEAQRLRGQGLGSRVLETAEELFKTRYGTSLVHFETETDFRKEGVQHNRGTFFRDNGYIEIADHTHPVHPLDISNAVLFAKDI